MNVFHLASSAKTPVTQLYSDLFILFPQRNPAIRWCYASVSLTLLSTGFVSWREVGHIRPLSDFFHCVKPHVQHSTVTQGNWRHFLQLVLLQIEELELCVLGRQKQSMSSVDLGPSNFLPPGHSNELSAECHIWPVMHRHHNTEQNIAKEPQFCIFPIKIGLEEAVQLEFKGRSYCPKFCIMHHNCLSTLCFKWESHITRKRHWCLSSKKAIRHQRD